MNKLINLFNEYVFNFINDINNLELKNSNISIFKLKLLLKYDDTVLIKYFNQFQNKYEIDIINMNEKIFMDKSINFLDQINIQKIWVQLNEKNKKIVWKYIKNLVKIIKLFRVRTNK